MQKDTILIAGGTGLIGTRLAEMLRTAGHEVRLLTRSPKTPFEFYWNPAKGTIDQASLKDISVVINLAGAGIADKRWTDARKKELVESRVQSAGLLYAELEKMSERPNVYLSASAIGIYGNSGEAILQENTPPVDQSFMVGCCQQWETAADQMSQLGIRVVKFRIGVVLAQEGGALAEIIKPLRWGLGAYFGDGQAWWSWIHRDDVCRGFIWGMETPSAAGVYNLVSPNAVRGKELVIETARAMQKWAIFMPAPAFALRLVLGEMSAVILNSNRVSAEKIREAGFEFKWPGLIAALRDIFAAKP